jgi:hypothetical protein
VKVIVLVRVVPLAVPGTVVNLTPTVQAAPGAKVVPVQLSAPTTVLKNQVMRLPPVPVIATEETVIWEPPVVGAVFVRVTVPIPVMAPEAKVIVSGFGVIDTLARAATPVPVSVTGEPVTVAPV